MNPLFTTYPLRACRRTKPITVLVGTHWKAHHFIIGLIQRQFFFTKASLFSHVFFLPVWVLFWISQPPLTVQHHAGYFKSLVHVNMSVYRHVFSI